MGSRKDCILLYKSYLNLNKGMCMSPILWMEYGKQCLLDAHLHQCENKGGCCTPTRTSSP